MEKKIGNGVISKQPRSATNIRHSKTWTVTIVSGIVVIIFLSLQLMGPKSPSFSSAMMLDSGINCPDKWTKPFTVNSNRKNNNGNDNDPVKKWMTEISGADETSCAVVFDKVRNGEWVDPNHGQLLYRRIVTEPHFVVSVHNQVYDRLRYDTIYKYGIYYEKEVISRFEYILEENRDAFDYEATNTLPLVLDIGGNIGFYTLLSAAWDHAVVTFEINPSNIIRICESLHLNELDEHGFSDLSHSMMVRIHQQGVSDTSGNTIRVEVPRNPGETSLENGPRKRASAGATSERVFSTTTVTLDDFATERGWLDRTDVSFSLVKIDTEGHELQIVTGAQKFIQSRRAKNILLEYRVHCREAMDILLDSGYVIVTSTMDAKGNSNRKMLSKQGSITFLDAETKRLRRSKQQYLDFWFRLDTLAL